MQSRSLFPMQCEGDADANGMDSFCPYGNERQKTYSALCNALVYFNGMLLCQRVVKIQVAVADPRQLVLLKLKAGKAANTKGKFKIKKYKFKI